MSLRLVSATGPRQLFQAKYDYNRMKNRWLFLSGFVYFITFRTEEGLPFVPLSFMNMLIQSALARAQALYPVQLIAFTVEANHVHMLIRVIDPEATSRFIGYFKAESANCLNRLRPLPSAGLQQLEQTT